MKTEVPYYRKKLEEELRRRVEKNPQYSLRSFARALGLEGGPLSQILSGRRFISSKIAEKIFSKLELNTSEQRLFLASLAKARTDSGLTRSSPKFRDAVNVKAPFLPKQRDLASDAFQVISDWYYYAILEMAEAADFDPHPRALSARLGISQTEARIALERLQELEMLENVEGKFRKTHLRFSTLDKNKTSASHRKRQKQILAKSIESLENDPIEIRNHSSITFAIDPTKIPQARELIEKFFWEMSEFLTTSSQSVYELNVGLFPLEKPLKVKGN